jgi:hypothetical protein
LDLFNTTSFLSYVPKCYEPLHTPDTFPMYFTFLAASDGTRMAKSFVRSAGSLVTTPYPHVRRFWSFTRNAADLDQLYALLVTHAEAGHCLLKGQLDRPLRHESRAGRTDPNAPTDLLVLDLDTDQGFADIDAFLEAIGLGGVSYVLHHSSSAGITATPGLRAHVLVHLSDSRGAGAAEALAPASEPHGPRPARAGQPVGQRDDATPTRST